MDVFLGFMEKVVIKIAVHDAMTVYVTSIMEAAPKDVYLVYMGNTVSKHALLASRVFVIRGQENV